ncbi:hypothetical protein KKD57_04790 [Patescibacteria group bacterium]|nr:hypothetical protein [Patescibacteria group bacterium]
MDGAASVNTNPDNVWDHSMIIVAKTSNELFVAYHTTNTRLRSVTEMRASFSKAKFTAFHLKDSGDF